MRTLAVSLDCAGTLVEADWDPPRFVVRCARAIGCSVDPERDAAAYARLLHERSASFLQVNLLRDPAASDRFWWELAEDWCDQVGLPKTVVPRLTVEAEGRLFGECGEVFRLYDDVLPALQSMRDAGLRMAVVSNWDTSLHRVLRMFGIDAHLEIAMASLEEGFEKPDPRLFRLAVERLGVQPEAVQHVGDDPVDDYDGARGAGLQAVLLDRSRPSDLPYRIRSLSEIQEVLAWTG